MAEHCNLSCRACSHLSPVVPKSLVDPANVFRDLSALARCYHVKSVRVLGGEPLLHPDLPSVIDAIRRSKICDAVWVITNGRLLPRMTTEFWSSIDLVEVSLYPGQHLDPDARDACTAQARKHGVKLRFHVRNEFQESYSEAGTEDTELVRRIFTTCNVVHRWRCHNVIDGWFYRCPQSHFIAKVTSDGGEHVDGIKIDDDPSFGTRLLAFLQSPDVPRACNNCLGTSGRLFPHTQIRRVDFRSRQAAPTEDLVHPRLVGSTRLGLARLEATTPRRILDSAENFLYSPGLLPIARAGQTAARAIVRGLGRTSQHEMNTQRATSSRPSG